MKVERKSEDAMPPGRKLPKSIPGMAPSVFAAKTDFLPPHPLLPRGAKAELRTGNHLGVKQKKNKSVTGQNHGEPMGNLVTTVSHLAFHLT
jgi:hypothetical protein